jgi:hypothetical protein
MKAHRLLQRTVFENPSLCEVALPLTESLRKIHPNGTFPLHEDPNLHKKATILGMFVLRPVHAPFMSTPNDGVVSVMKSMYEVETGWAYNLKGVDGGGTISNFNGVDAFRLALQYGCSDAVIMGSKSLCLEGCDTVFDGETQQGYVFQPYVLCQWGSLREADEDLEGKLDEQRRLWQDMGYLSQRKYPAQIVVTRTGRHFPNSRYFLEARIFHDSHPNGEQFEVYIITSRNGAAEIKSKAHMYGLQDRIDDMLIILSPEEAPSEIAYTQIPEYLYSKLDMKIVDHDGGQHVLRDFVRAGVVGQINLSLMKGQSLRDVIESRLLPEPVKSSILTNFDASLQTFFTNSTGMLPSHLQPMQIVEDAHNEIAVVSFVMKGVYDI